ncbi:MAG: 16S rRNA (cytidine(1402)-2'-O)-methyltransferase [bacterium]|nr:16S rRNA (cytidine(1402)-2'-O)-methyltransferase [bacterium]
MGELYIVATPIGNLKDITLRALDILKEADLILAEDTRVTMKILERYELKDKNLQSYHQHSSREKIQYILDFLSTGKKVALVSDSGTPGISDPGNMLIKEITGKDPSVKIIPIPGPSALAAAASISGFPMDKFIFMGFPPSKKKRKKFFAEVVESKYPVVLYESPHRILKTIADLKEASQGLDLVVCRELTKKFETVVRGRITEIEELLIKSGLKGEFVVVVKNEDR